ncbi:MAG: hypothetical protein WDN25_30535 [Acetobacteraceae bacterium]
MDANFKESQLAHMRPGMPVTVTADVLPGEAFRGHVASLAPATGAVFSVLPPENATGNFTKIVQRVPVRVVLDGTADALGRLRPACRSPPRSTCGERQHGPAGIPAAPPVVTPGEMAMVTKVIAFASMCVGFFIALLDIQIVSASLADSAAGCPPAPTRSPGCRPAT